MSVSIVPSAPTGQTIYQVLDDLGKYGHVWSELAENEADEHTVIEWITEGQFKRPLRVIAFNTNEGWSRDVTQEIAWKVRELNYEGRLLSAAARKFVERLSVENPLLAV
jgi:hypothetical protein